MDSVLNAYNLSANQKINDSYAMFFHDEVKAMDKEEKQKKR
jgi:hypothetical protein